MFTVKLFILLILYILIKMLLFFSLPSSLSLFVLMANPIFETYSI